MTKNKKKSDDKTGAAGATDTLDLKTRDGLPGDLLFLAAKYPREIWPNHENLGEMSRFWLQRHDMFRKLSAALLEGTAALHGRQVEPQPFHGWFVPQFNFFLEQLHSHHRVEDHHYFPLLMKVEKKLKRGFDLLDGDHKLIHQGLLNLLDTGRELDVALRESPARLPAAAAGMVGALDNFIKDMQRHLTDEEDLVIPLILDRGESELGVH